jgi:molecular chaperone DnaJ
MVGPRGGPSGDLFVHLRVRPHERFRRRNADLLCDLHVTMTQAALGVVVRFETLDGAEDLVVARGTQSGREFTLRGRGVPRVDGRGRGDLLVRVVVDTPVELSRSQEDMLRQLAEDRGEEVAPPGEGLLSRIRSAFK